MRIFYIYRAIAQYRGMERIFVDKVNNLARMYGDEVYLVTADQGRHPIAYPLDDRAHFVDMNIRFHQIHQYGIVRRLWKKVQLQFLFVRRLKAAIRDLRPDLLVCNTDVYTNLVILSKGRLPLVVESHSICRETLGNYTASLPKRIYRRFSFWNMRHADVLVALTEADAAAWRKVNRNVCAIPNVVHLNDKGRYSRCDAKRVIFPSRFAEQKGIPFLLDIWKKVHSRYPEWQLDIYGEGELRDHYLPMIERLDINIHVHAPSNDIFEHYLESSVFILTSTFEPFGLVLPEAMSCGLPVVAFDCDFGPREIITDGADGFLVPLGDTDAFADRVCQLVEDEELRRAMGRAGIESSQRYTAERIMPRWKDLFEKLIERKRQ